MITVSLDQKKQVEGILSEWVLNRTRAKLRMPDVVKGRVILSRWDASGDYIHYARFILEGGLVLEANKNKFVEECSVNDLIPDLGSKILASLHLSKYEISRARLEYLKRGVRFM